MRLLEAALQYAEDVVSGKEIAPDEVVYICKKCLNDYHNRQYDENFEFYFDEDELAIYENLCELIIYPSGFAEGEPFLDHVAPFQAFFITMFFSWRYKEKPYKFRFNNVILFIARKNGKTFLAAVIFLLLMLTEQKNSEFYSVCLTKELAAELRKAMAQILAASPALCKHFFVSKSITGIIKCLLNNNFYMPRVAEAGKNNSIRPSAFCADEVGNFKDKENINAMKSGQRNVLNPIKIQTTTAYAIDTPIFTDDIEYVKKVSKGLIEDERLFALMYYANEDELWDDIGIYKANPLRIEENYEEIRECRAKALEMESEREEYLTKSLNYFVAESSAEQYINIEDVRECRATEPIDWHGRDVYIGVDLSQSSDNTSICMLSYDIDEEKFYCKSWAFVPEVGLMNKEKIEHVPYRRYIEKGYCYIAKHKMPKKTINYTFVAKFVEDIENELGVNILGVGYDPYNASTCVSYWEDELGYDTEALKQTSSVLYPATKLLREVILQQDFTYDVNELLEINFENARCTEDTNRNIYVNKKKSINGKVDMVVAIINAMYFWKSDIDAGLIGGNEDIMII